MVLVVGVISSAAGMWTVQGDFGELEVLFNQEDGWLFTVPILLVVADITLTMIGLAPGSRIVELNPFVASAVVLGTAALAPFILSYMALSEGVALLMLSLGKRLFHTSGSLRYLPYSAICGAASLGPLSNMALIANPDLGWLGYLLGAFGAVLLTVLVFRQIGKRAGQMVEIGAQVRE